MSQLIDRIIVGCEPCRISLMFPNMPESVVRRDVQEVAKGEGMDLQPQAPETLTFR